MAASGIQIGVGVDGEATLKQALESINAEIKNLSAGVKATDAEMKAFGESEELTAKKNEQLSQQIDVLNKKMEALQKQHDNASAKLEQLADALEAAKEAGDETAIAAATNEYNKQATVVSNLSAQMARCQKDIADAAGAMEDGADNADDLADAMDDSGGSADDLAGTLQSLASTAGSVADAVGGAVVEGIKKLGSVCLEAVNSIKNLTIEAGQYADTILTISEQSGVDPIDYQKWEYASQFIDTEVGTITSSMKRLTMNMGEESSAAGEALAQLGVKATDASGNLRDSEEVFWEAIDALGQVGNATERDQLAMSLFGQSAQALNPLINAGSQAFKQLGTEAEQMGVILDGDALNGLGSFDDAMNKLNSTITGAGRQIAAAFAPALTSVTNDLQGVVQAFIGMVTGVEGSGEQFKTAVRTLCDNVSQILHDLLPVVIEVGIEIIMSLAEAIIDNLDTIIDAALDIILSLVDGLIDNIDKLVDAALKLIIGLAEGLIKALPRLVEKAPEIISSVCDALLDGISMLWDVGKAWIEGIWEGIKNTADWLWKQVKGFFNDTIQGIMNIFGIGSPSKLFRDEVGKQIVTGFALGITDNLGIVEDAYARMLPDSGMFAQGADGFSVAARAAAEDGGSMLWQDNRPIVLELNDRELGRAVRGYV